MGNNYHHPESYSELLIGSHIQDETGEFDFSSLDNQVRL